MTPEECRRRAAAMLDGSDESKEAVADAWIDIHSAEVNRRSAEPPTSTMREHAAQIVDAIEKLERLADPTRYDFGSPMFNLMMGAPSEALAEYRGRIRAVAEGRSPRRGNADATRKRRAAEFALKLLDVFAPKARVLDKQRAELAAYLVGDADADMTPYITDAKKHPG